MDRKNKSIENKEKKHIHETADAGRTAVRTGILCNVLLFLVKLTIGLVSGSVAVVSDSFNNLTDCISNFITLAGLRIAEKPADSRHPFGHGRVEYIASFILTVLIFLAAAEFMRTSIDRILHPGTVSFHPLMAALLVISMAVKLWLAGYYEKAASATRILSLQAAAADSRSDVLVTLTTVIAMAVYLIGTSLPADGIAGVIVSICIFKAGYDIARAIIDRLLGSPADSSLAAEISSLLNEEDEILGVHDLILHDYGPDVRIGSAHIELDGHLPFIRAHEIADAAERKIQSQLHVQMTLHMDPVEDDERTKQYLARCRRVIRESHTGITLHDFHLKADKGEVILYFDLQMPFGTAWIPSDIKAAIDREFADDPVPVRACISFDQGYLTGVKQ